MELDNLNDINEAEWVEHYQNVYETSRRLWMDQCEECKISTLRDELCDGICRHCQKDPANRVAASFRRSSFA